MPSAVPTKAQWKSMVKGKDPSAEIDRCTVLVSTYHLKSAADVSERTMILDQMLELSGGYLRDHGVASPESAVIGQLGLCAEKEKRLIQTATRGWSAARKVFGASKGALGPTRTVQHRYAGGPNPMSVRNYWLEAVDPRHRSWGHMDASVFDDWLNSDTEISFWDWLERHHRSDVEGVQYLAPDDRWKYWIVFGNDRLLYRHDPGLGPRGKGGIPLARFSTRGMWTAFSRDHFAIWVCSPNGIFYSNSHRVSKFHHSSFLAGGRVLAAGEWVVSQGLILLITHKTGHYMASAQNLLNAVRLLDARTDLRDTVVAQTDYATGTTRYVKARDFLAAGGNASRCHRIKDRHGDLVDIAASARARAARGEVWGPIR